MGNVSSQEATDTKAHICRFHIQDTVVLSLRILQVYVLFQFLAPLNLCAHKHVNIHTHTPKFSPHVVDLVPHLEASLTPSSYLIF